MYQPWCRSDPYDARMANLERARRSPRYRPPRPWRSKDEGYMIRRYVFWWFTCAIATSHLGVPGLGSLASAIRGCRNLFGDFREIPMKCGGYKQPKVTPNSPIWSTRRSARGRCGTVGNCVRLDIDCRSVLLGASKRQTREMAAASDEGDGHGRAEIV